MIKLMFGPGDEGVQPPARVFGIKVNEDFEVTEWPDGSVEVRCASAVRIDPVDRDVVLIRKRRE